MSMDDRPNFINVSATPTMRIRMILPNSRFLNTSDDEKLSGDALLAFEQQLHA